MGSKTKNKTSSGTGGKAEAKKPSEVEAPTGKAAVVPEKLFGGWTGKTPVTLLNEYIQRQQGEGWHRASYNVQGNNEFSCVIRLTRQDKKLGQQTVVFKPVATESTGLRFPTAAEARHMAATYALFRMRANTSLHRLLPPVHRAYWLDLEQVKKKDDREWVYAEDPFAAQAARDREQADRETQRTKARERRERAADAGRHEDLLGPGLRRRWDALAEAHMSEAQRLAAETVVRQWTATWQLGAMEKGEEGEEEDRTRARLEAMGFRPPHVAEAVAAAGAAGALAWLCVHVPEDDQPASVLARAYRPALVVDVGGTGGSLARQRAAQRLARLGFPLSACQAALDSAGSDDVMEAEALAADALIQQACGQPIDSTEEDGVSIPGDFEDEVAALDAIYAGEGRVTRAGAFHVSVRIGPDASLDAWLPPRGGYPALRPPALALASDALPAHLKLHVTRTLARELPRDGLPVLCDAVALLDAHLDAWLAAVPPLAALAQPGRAAEAVVGDPPAITRSARKPNNMTILNCTRALAESQLAVAARPLHAQRMRLPAATAEAEITGLVASHGCVVVAGATGSGKTTQVAQFLLDAGAQARRATFIVCTQPRRISAVSVAARVAAERGEAVGHVVGYAVRGESRRSGDTRLLFCTVGVLLRMLASDPRLVGVTHVVCDEVHERSVDSDVALALLRRARQMRPGLRLALMSATAQGDAFARYFGQSGGLCPSVSIAGRAFPVAEVFAEDLVAQLARSGDSALDPVFGPGWAPRALARAAQDSDAARALQARAQELAASAGDVGGGAMAALAAWEQRFSAPLSIDYALAAAAVRHIHATDRGLSAVLVFMPGAAEISQTIAALSDIESLWLVPLHAGLAPAEQRRVFAHAPAGQRKVVVATNVAETGITVDDVAWVVDSGRVRELRHDPAVRVAKLTTAWCSRAAATQRAGRAGRTQPGTCIRLYTRRSWDAAMPAYAEPEILRTPLEQVCLQVRSLVDGEGGDPRVILDALLDPPPHAAVAHAERLLAAMGAVDSGEGLTALGRFMALIPVDLRLAKMLVMGALLGVLDDAVRVVALMALDRPLFSTARADRDATQKSRAAFAAADGAGSAPLSDWLADLAAFDALADAGAAACRRAHVAPEAVRDAKANMRLLRDALRHTGLLAASSTRQPFRPMVLKAVVFAGLTPNLVRVRLPRPKFTEVISGTVTRDHEPKELAFYALDLVSPAAASGSCGWKSHDTRAERRVFIHPQSTLFSCTTRYRASPFVAYFAQSANDATDRVYLRDATVPGLYALLMFGPAPLNIDHDNKVVVLGGSGALALRAWPRIAVLVTQLRGLLDELLRRKLGAPQDISLPDHPVVQTVLRLIETDGH
ncbi:helicase [Coemansia sp. RSA 2322]|nr:helicase [Coemansia sp. RSA 2322]